MVGPGYDTASGFGSPLADQIAKQLTTELGY
jgi:hypothetical protein